MTSVISEQCHTYFLPQALSLELERKYPKLYAGSCRQMGLTVVTEKMIAKNLSNMALHIFKKDITWFKVASFYNLVSSAAVDCVRQGHPEYLYGLVEAAGLVIERDVATWIANQGGWVSPVSNIFNISDGSEVIPQMSGKCLKGKLNNFLDFPGDFQLRQIND